MPYLIDSDYIIDRLAPDGISISIITYMETYQGVVRSPNLKEAQAKFRDFRKTIPVLPFSLSAAKQCATLREQLKREGKRVKSRALDLINASIALEYNLILVTRNIDDYKDIPGLQIH